MATTTVRLNEQEQRWLDELAEEHGGRSNVLRAGLRILAEQHRQREGLAEWLREHGAPVTEEEIEEAGRRYFAA